MGQMLQMLMKGDGGGGGVEGKEKGRDAEGTQGPCIEVSE
jgi:hypothetical protein